MICPDEHRFVLNDQRYVFEGAPYEAGSAFDQSTHHFLRLYGNVKCGETISTFFKSIFFRKQPHGHIDMRLPDDR